MIEFLKNVPESRKFSRLFATIDPENIASLKSAQKAGFEIRKTTTLYGGFLRHILLLEN